MKKVVWIFAVIFVVALGIAYKMNLDQAKKQEHVLKVYNPIDIIEKSLVDSTLLRKGYGHTIGDFSFTNQYGETITQADIKEKIFVADYFFTTCGSICPKMTAQMTRVQGAFLNNPDVMILSHTVWPEVDTVEQMLRYAKEKGVRKGKWHLLTGDKEHLYELARKSYFVLKPTEAEDVGDGESDFIHTNNFVLVDKKRRIRGYYDGTSSEEVDHLIRDIKILLDE
ncbi:SCO family protein [Wandonia haliotis]|uniref:SCO family protein n=1 Tax=Wandonia haliotis TaxID=574963 RepID=A0ABN1MUC1_9FLAO